MYIRPECWRFYVWLDRLKVAGVPENATETSVDTNETSEQLKSIAIDGIVLLKNESNALPLQKDKTVDLCFEVFWQS